VKILLAVLVGLSFLSGYAVSQASVTHRRTEPYVAAGVDAKREILYMSDGTVRWQEKP
jgi:hypothetical protein